MSGALKQVTVRAAANSCCVPRRNTSHGPSCSPVDPPAGLPFPLLLVSETSPWPVLNVSLPFFRWRTLGTARGSSQGAARSNLHKVPGGDQRPEAGGRFPGGGEASRRLTALKQEIPRMGLGGPCFFFFPSGVGASLFFFRGFKGKPGGIGGSL